MPSPLPSADKQVNPFGYVSFSPSSGAATLPLVRAGVGTLEVVTTNGGVLELSPHPAVAIYASSARPRVSLLDVLTTTRLDLNVSNESSTSRVVVHLPVFDAVCVNRTACVFRLEVGDAPTYSCPGGHGPDLSVCFGEVRAMRTPAELRNGNASASYHAVRYVNSCAGTFEPPNSPLCTASVESAQRCAFGELHECRACPYGGHCPGGYEVRSFPGFYLISSANGIIKHCDEPSTERCVGWDAQLGVTACGKGYTGRCSISLEHQSPPVVTSSCLQA